MNTRTDARMRRRVCAALAVVAVPLAVPAVAPAAEEGNTKNPQREYLFVQNARSGTFVPLAGRAGRYTLTLRGVDRHALYFSDRPSRETGVIPQEALIGALYRPDMPAPNAAITLSNGGEDADVVAVELSHPRYDAKRHTLRYDARRLRAPSSGLRHLDDRLDRSLPRRFGAVSLFIDDGTSFGNVCAVNLANATDGVMVAQSSSNWATDTWDFNPIGAGIPNDGQTHPGGSDHGGAFRGCSFDVTWSMNDGSIIDVQTTDPEPTSDPNVWTCTPSNQQRYSCILDERSRLHGPILLVYWTVTFHG